VAVLSQIRKWIFQLALSASGFSTCAGRLFPAENAGHLLPRNLSRASLLYSGISFGFSVASRISFGTERIVVVLVAVSGVEHHGLGSSPNNPRLERRFKSESVPYSCIYYLS
jgi:hypothetical protein